MLAGGVGRTVAVGAGAAVTGRAAIGGGRPREVPGGGRAAAEGAGVKGMDVCVRLERPDDRPTTDARCELGQQRFVARFAIADLLVAAEPMDEVRAVLDRAGHRANVGDHVQHPSRCCHRMG